MKEGEKKFNFKVMATQVSLKRDITKYLEKVNFFKDAGQTAQAGMCLSVVVDKLNKLCGISK